MSNSLFFSTLLYVELSPLCATFFVFFCTTVSLTLSSCCCSSFCHCSCSSLSLSGYVSGLALCFVVNAYLNISVRITFFSLFRTLRPLVSVGLGYRSVAHGSHQAIMKWAANWFHSVRHHLRLAIQDPSLHKSFRWLPKDGKAIFERWLVKLFQKLFRKEKNFRLDQPWWALRVAPGYIACGIKLV